MKGLHLKMAVWVVSFIFVGLFLFVGCCRLPYKPVRAFPAPVPENAKVSINFNEDGEFFIADQKGEAISVKPIHFDTLLETADKADPGWIDVLGSFALYQVKEERNVWLCDKDFQCIEGQVEDENDGAVFSLNYDGRKLFFASASGKELTVKDLKPFVSLVQDTYLRSKIGIKTLDTFTIYIVKGSKKLLIYSPITNSCLCVCVHSDWTTSGCVNGGCPPN
jgi:hypothetical protein